MPELRIAPLTANYKKELFLTTEDCTGLGESKDEFREQPS